MLIYKEEPVAVWTGSTNISPGGIFGHSNVGHEIWDGAIAKRYLAFWTRLSDADVKRAPLVEKNLEVEPTPADFDLADDRIRTLYSPRDDAETLETLKWYAATMDSARHIMCMTFAFNLDAVFEKVLLKAGDTLRYAVFDKTLDQDVVDQIDAVKNTVIAAGALLKKGGTFPRRAPHRLQYQPLYPRQIHSGRSAREATDRRDRYGEFQRGIAGRQ